MTRRLEWHLAAPETELASLRVGDAVEMSGRVLTFRDASAARVAHALHAGEPLPVPLQGRILYAVGPSPAKPGQVIGSAGPTTTARMGRYLPALFSAGVRAIIGKGELRGPDLAAFTDAGAMYFAAVGGVGALLAKQIAASTLVAYDDLGAEALFELELTAFPAIVAIDRSGQNLHAIARARWRAVRTDP